jgi:hypothetical protein
MSVAVTRNLALEIRTDIERWSNPSALEPAWDRRAKFAADFIPPAAACSISAAAG